MKQNKIKCLWCNKYKNTNELSIIYGKNTYFEEKKFYACKGLHIKNIKKYLEHADKSYSYFLFSIVLCSFLYPILFLTLKKYSYWVTVVMCSDFGIGLLLTPFITPDLTKKIGIKMTIILARIIAIVLLITSLIFIIKYFIIGY